MGNFRSADGCNLCCVCVFQEDILIEVLISSLWAKVLPGSQESLVSLTIVVLPCLLSTIWLTHLSLLSGTNGRPSFPRWFGGVVGCLNVAQRSRPSCSLKNTVNNHETLTWEPNSSKHRSVDSLDEILSQLSSFSGYEGLNSGIDAMRYLQRAQQIGKVPWGRRFQFLLKQLKVHQVFVFSFFLLKGLTLLWMEVCFGWLMQYPRQHDAKCQPDWLVIRIHSAMPYMKQSFHKLCQVVLTQPSRMQLVNDGRYVLSGGVGALGLATLKAIGSAFDWGGRSCLYWAPVPTKLGKSMHHNMSCNDYFCGYL